MLNDNIVKCEYCGKNMVITNTSNICEECEHLLNEMKFQMEYFSSFDKEIKKDTDLNI